jgi:PAS domain S-box-containing protein
MADNPPDSIFLIDTKGMILSVSQTPQGPPGGDVIGTSIVHHVPLKSHTAVKTTLSKALTTGLPQYCEIHGPLFGIEATWFRIRMIPLPHHRDLTTILLIATDATKQQQTEKALKESEERFRALIEKTSDWIWEVDTRGTYVYASPKVKDILGYEPDEVLGKTPFDLMPPEEAVRIKAEFEKIVMTRKAFDRLENMNLHKDGRLVVMETSGVPIFDQQGALCGYRGIDRDITERKRSEDELRKNEQMLQSTFGNAPIGRCLVSLDGRFMKVNEALCRMIGYSESELLSMTVNEVTHPDDLSISNEWIRTLQSAEDPPKDLEKRYLHKDGHTVWGIVRSSLVRDADAHPLFFSSHVQDITKRKKMENKILESWKRLQMHARELEESNTALKVLLKQRENDKREIEEKILSNIKHLILPYITKLKLNRKMSDELVYLNILESNMKEIISPFSICFSSNYLNLTPREILIADLIKDGKQDKEITEILNISLDTVKSHRKNLRKKLGIVGKKTNLRSHLLAFSK